ncbi:hypothetical protein [Desulfobulbus sp.]|uniref:hypothetical protein n=1 Tax=Desulfobulbus sp. TaxID=895 RepID=UPI0027B94AD6|nr:hypothetical protein [Desulfobulbus sp.]
MKKICFALMLLTSVVILPHSIRAEVNVSIGFALPAPVVFDAPPEMIVLPDTNNVYVAPDSDFDLFFWNGWWWRPWEGRWYRSHSYNRGWTYYRKVPSFYYDVDPGWRGYYRDRNWSGNRWEYERIPNQRLHNNWKKWQTNHYWQKNKTWGVENHQPRPQQQTQEIRRQRQEHYQQLPEVQRHQQLIQEQQQQIQTPQRRPQAQRQPQRVQQAPHKQPQAAERQIQAPKRRPQAQQQHEQEQNKRQPQVQRQQEKQVPQRNDAHSRDRQDQKKSPPQQLSQEEQDKQARMTGRGQ